MRTANKTALNHFWWTCRANEKSKKKRIFNGARSTLVESNIIESGRAEPTKEAFDSISFVAERPTEPYLFISGGRAEI